MYTKTLALAATLATLHSVTQAISISQDDTTTVKIPYYEKATDPTEIGWFKGSTYQGKPASEKLADLMQMINADTSGPHDFMWEQFPELFTGDTNHAFSQASDEMSRKRNKVVHTQGVVAQVKFVPDSAGNQYPGLLGEEYDKIILRFSQTTNLHEDSEGLLPSVALKFLRDGVTSTNMLAMPSFYDTDSWNFFESDMTTRVEPFGTESVSDRISRATLVPKFANVSKRVFAVGNKEPIVQNVRGELVDVPEGVYVPFKIEFSSSHSTSSRETWVQDLMNIPVDSDTPLMEMWAVDDKENQTERRRIGHLELVTPLTTSVFGDERLYFQHVKSGGDFAYMINHRWTRDDEIEEQPDLTTLWEADDLANWPTDPAAAEEKFVQQIRTFGCPFAWVLGLNTEQDLADAEANGSI